MYVSSIVLEPDLVTKTNPPHRDHILLIQLLFHICAEHEEDQSSHDC